MKCAGCGALNMCVKKEVDEAESSIINAAKVASDANSRISKFYVVLPVRCEHPTDTFLGIYHTIHGEVPIYSRKLTQ